MKKILSKIVVTTSLLMVSLFVLASTGNVFAQNATTDCVDGKIVMGATNEGKPCVQVNTNTLGFQIPSLSDLLSFAIRAIFVFGGLAALFFLLLGAFAWITSGGEKDKIKAAQDKITNAVIGVIMIAVVLAIVVTLEQVIFAGRICLGISCPLTIPSIIKPN